MISKEENIPISTLNSIDDIYEIIVDKGEQKIFIIVEPCYAQRFNFLRQILSFTPGEGFKDETFNEETIKFAKGKIRRILNRHPTITWIDPFIYNISGEKIKVDIPTYPDGKFFKLRGGEYRD